METKLEEALRHHVGAVTANRRALALLKSAEHELGAARDRVGDHQKRVLETADAVIQAAGPSDRDRYFKVGRDDTLAMRVTGSPYPSDPVKVLLVDLEASGEDV